MSRWWVCCCGDSNGGVNDAATRGQINTVEGEYLLPGSEWDTSRSGSVWSSFRGSRKKGKKKGSDKKPLITHSVVGLDSPSGDYEPPAVPPSQKLPAFDEFRLLKTVGRGAFGKVRLVCISLFVYRNSYTPS